MAFYIDQSGEVVESDATPELASFNGYAPASPEQVEAARANAAREAEFGTVGQQVITGVEGALRGGTFSGSDYLLTKSGLVDPARMAARREVNAPLATATEVGGALLPIAFSGGTGALGSAARLAPTAMASRAAAAGAEALVGAAPTAGRAIARTVLSEAAEAAPYAIGEIITEASLGNKDLTAEGVLSDVGMSALLSGGAGAILGGAGVAIPKALRKARDVVERGDKAVTGLVREWLPRTGAALSDVDPATTTRLLDNMDALQIDPVKKAASEKQFAELVQEADDQTEALQRIIDRLVRPDEMAIVLAGVPSANGEAAVVDVAAMLRARAAAARADPLVGNAHASKLEALADDMERSYRGPAQRTGYGQARYAPRSAAQAYEPLDRLKKDLDGLSDWDATKSNEAKNLYREVRSEVKKVLEDTNRWGEQGARQAALNMARHEAFKASELLLSKFGTSAGKGERKVIDPVKIKTYLNAAADDRARLRGDAIDGAFEALRNLADQTEISAAASPVKDFYREGIDALLRDSGDAIAEARRKAEVTHLMKQLSQPGITSTGPAIMPRSALGALGKATLGGAVAGPVGAAVGAGAALFDLAGNVPAAIATLATFKRMAERTSAAMTAAADLAVRGGRKVSPIVRGSTAKAVARLVADDDDDLDYVELANNPDKMADALDNATRDIAPHAPQMAESVQQAIIRRTAYMASIAPKPPANWPFSAEWTPSPADKMRVTVAREALSRPDALLLLAQKGALTTAHVEALTQAAPELLAEQRAKAMEAIARAEKPPPYDAQQQLAILFGQDMNGSLSTLAANQAAYEANPAPAAPAPPRSSTERSTRMMTPLQQAEVP